MMGGFGADTLNGFGGEDILNGGAGRDTLIGGQGADIFQFYQNAGDDTIFAWEDGTDRIDLIAFDFNPIDPAGQLNAAISTSGSSTIVDLTALGGNGSITIFGVVSGIDAGDFIL